MKFLKSAIRFISLPILGLTMLAYPEIRYNKYQIVYTWYRSKKGYDSIIQQYDDNDGCQSYEKWQLAAEERVVESLEKGLLFVKVAMIPNKLMEWLQKKGFENTIANREKYAFAVYELTSENGIESKI